MRRLILFVIAALVLAACNAQPEEAVIEVPPTATLQPIPSLTPRVTATLAPTNTPRPTFTPTPTLTEIPPTASNTPTPTLTPTVVGIINALNRINMREGPGVDFDVITGLAAGTGVQILTQNADGTWFNVRLLDDEDNREGWVAASLIRVEPTPTPFPTLTPSPDLTALFLGTPLPPTQLIPGRVTATPPRQVQTGTPEDTADETEETPPTAGALAGVPTIDNSAIFQTATALAGGIAQPTDRPTTTGDDEERVITVAPETTAATSGDPTAIPSPTPGRVRRIFAFCDDPTFGSVTQLPVVNAGDNLEIWWGWFASTDEQVQEHIDASNLELRVNGELIEDANRYVGEIQTLSGGTHVAYWEVPFGPVESGEYIITYQVTWDRAIYDGVEFFGPGTENPFEQEACTITVP